MPRRQYAVEPKGGQLPIASPHSIEESYAEEKALKRANKSGRQFIERRAQELMPRQELKQGSLTRGWSLDFPRGPVERKKVYDECGPQCFLTKPTIGPKGGWDIGFPVCRRCPATGKCDCRVDPRGVQAAYQRARQHGHDAVAAKALQLKEQLGLPKQTAPRARRRRRRTKQLGD